MALMHSLHLLSLQKFVVRMHLHIDLFLPEIENDPLTLFEVEVYLIGLPTSKVQACYLYRIIFLCFGH